MADRIIILAATAFACIYGAGCKLHGLDHKYFKVILWGMTALLLSRIYYFIIYLSAGNDEILTIGTLGQASAYLFFLTANIHFLPEDMKRKKICIPGIAGTLIPIAMFVAAAIEFNAPDVWIGEIIYILTLGSAFYTSVKAIADQRENKGIFIFNICICGLILMNALFEMELAGVFGAAGELLRVVIASVSAALLIIMMPALGKGTRKWS